MYSHRFFSICAASLALFLVGCSRPAPQQTEAPKAAVEATPAEPTPVPTHAVAGRVEEVAADGSSVVIKTSDGKLHRIETPPQTETYGYKKAVGEAGKAIGVVAKYTANDLKKGTMVAVHFTEKEGKLVAHQVHHLYSETVKSGEVVIHKVEKTGEKIVVKTKDGVEVAYNVGKKAVVTAGQKIGDISKLVAGKTVEGAKATVHYTEEAGRKTVHFIEQK